MPIPDVVLVSDDLLLASRLRAVLAPVTHLAVTREGEPPAAATLFIDLNRDVEARLELISTIRARGGTRIIGFCQHDARSVRVRAMERGANQVVTNGALQEAAARLLGATAT